MNEIENNPFTLIKASDYSDAQINSLWVQVAPPETIKSIIEPSYTGSKYILGGKGSGKTHLLRYYSYPASRLRAESESGLDTVRAQGFLAIFLRATEVDAYHFEPLFEPESKWQKLFAAFLELRLAESTLHALCDIENTSNEAELNTSALLRTVSDNLPDLAIDGITNFSGLREWVVAKRWEIHDAVNEAAYTGSIDVRVPFSIGALCLPLCQSIRSLHPDLSEVSVLYMIDEIENFSEYQQQIVNTLIRYSEGKASFRITGRRYAVKSHQTYPNGEENRENSEYKTVYLDELLQRNYKQFCRFSVDFVNSRLQASGLSLPSPGKGTKPSPRQLFSELSPDSFFGEVVDQYDLVDAMEVMRDQFFSALRDLPITQHRDDISQRLFYELTTDLPLLLGKLNILLFCKKALKNSDLFSLADKIRMDAAVFARKKDEADGYYARAYGHYAHDLLAQAFKQSKKRSKVPYAGFETFVRMSSGNPRNLLVILGKIYDIASFKGVDFVSKGKVSIEIQTEAAAESARFMYESDTNFGALSAEAKDATRRLAEVFRTARYAINIPEVSPITFSFSELDLTEKSRNVLQSALNYSFLFEVPEGRPDRNNNRLNCKMQLNPLLSPKWDLPVGRRGDISFSKDILLSVFDPDYTKDFDYLLSLLRKKWNRPFRAADYKYSQQSLF